MKTICGAVYLMAALVAQAAADPPKGDFTVHDVSLWIADGAAPLANARTAYPSAFPVTVTSPRPAGSPTMPAALAPMGRIAFYGAPAGELDVDLRVRSGSFLAHWPTGESLPNRLRWAGAPGTSLVAAIDDPSSLLLVDEEHWFQKARTGDALFVRRGARAERFLAYDAELNMPAPIRLRGGPDKFTVANASGGTLHDVMIARLTPQGLRVVWIDELAGSAGAKTDAAKSNKASKDLFDDRPPAKAPAAAAAAGLFGVAKQPAGQPPKDATAKPAAGLFGVAGKPVAKAQGAPKEKPKAGLFGVAGAAPAGAKPKEQTAASEPPLTGGVELVLPQPLAVGSPQIKAATTDELSARLAKAGLSQHEVQLFVDQYAAALFGDKALVVFCRLDAATIEQQMPLSVFPEPKSILRVPLAVVRNVDPQLGDEVEQLIVQLGDEKFSVREAAQRKLIAMGPLAFAALKKAINHTDMEVVLRAERILLNQNQQADGRQGATGEKGNAAPAKAAPAAAPAAGAKAAVLGLLRIFGK
jgi:hypothetical protein